MAKVAKTAKPVAAAKAAKAKPLTAAQMDAITTVTHDTNNSYVCVNAVGGQPMLTYERSRETPELRKLAVKGGSYKAVKAAIAALPPAKAKLARGLDSRTAPHSAKAAADSRKANSGDAPATKAAKPAKAPAPKAAKNKQPSRGVERDYGVGSKAVDAKPDTWRHHMLTTIVKHGNTAKAKAAHAKSGKFSANKLDFNWANAQGYIKFAK